LYPKEYKMNLENFVKEKRKAVKLTQAELAEKAGVGLRDKQLCAGLQVAGHDVLGR